MPQAKYLGTDEIYQRGDLVPLIMENYATSNSGSSTSWDYVSGASSNVQVDFGMLPTERFEEILVRVGGYVDNDGASGQTTEFTFMDNENGDYVIADAAVIESKSSFSPFTWGPLVNYNTETTAALYGMYRVSDGTTVGTVNGGVFQIIGRL